jgi:beta-lactamase class A
MKYTPILCVVSGAVLFAGGMYVGGHSDEEGAGEQHDVQEYTSDADVSQMMREQKGGYKFINPILDCENASLQLAAGAGILYRTIQAELHARQDVHKVPTMAVYYRDLTNGPWFGIDVDQDFAPASLTKVPLMIAAYKKAEQDPTFLAKEITISKEVADLNLEENIRSVEVVEAGKAYSIGALVERMIKYSDNAAAVTVLSAVESRAIEEVFEQIGVPVNMNGNDLALSVKEYASFYRVLFNASYLNREWSERALTLLSEAEFKEGLVAGVSGDIPVAHKFGERRRDDLPAGERMQLHDCGIVYHPNQPYLLCVMTRGDDIAAQTTLIAEVSRILFSAVTEHHAGDTQ